MTREKFETLVSQAFSKLPDTFSGRIENVQITVADWPDDDQLQKVGSSRRGLLGLYEGIPLSHRNTWYGTAPTLPDRITLFQKNIEDSCRTDEEIERKIEEVLFHELGHYFGMDEKAIRTAMKDFN